MEQDDTEEPHHPAGGSTAVVYLTAVKRMSCGPSKTRNDKVTALYPLACLSTRGLPFLAPQYPE